MALPWVAACARAFRLEGLPFLAKPATRCLTSAVRTEGAPPARQMRTEGCIDVARVSRERARLGVRRAAVEEPTVQAPRTGTRIMRWLQWRRYHAMGRKLLGTVSTRARSPRWTPLHNGNLQDQLDYVYHIGGIGCTSVEGYVSSTLDEMDANEVMFRRAREGRRTSRGLRLPMNLAGVRDNSVVAALGSTSIVPLDLNMTTEMMLISVIP